MNRAPASSLPALVERALAATSRLVPPHLRERWLEEWRGELWHISQQHGDRWVLAQIVGAVRDAVATRSLPSSRRHRQQQRGGHSMLAHDLRTALRTLARRPGFTAVALLTLGIGLGANTAVFTTVRSILFEPLPYRDAERLVLLFERRPHQSREQNPVSLPDFTDWRAAELPAFDDMAAWAGTGAALTGRKQPLSLSGARVTESFFTVLGVEPQLGRTFSAEETRTGATGAVVITHRLWQSAFGGDPRIVGTAIELDGKPNNVVGVMPPELVYPFDVDYWSALTMDPAESGRGSHYLGVIARLEDGASIEQGYSELDVLTKRLETEYPEENTQHYGNVLPIRETSLGVGSPRVLWMLFAAVALVLLIVCSNVAGMQLSRGIARQRELAVRASIGASRLRLVRELLAENLVLGLGGGFLGLLVAHGLTRALAARLGEWAPWVEHFGLGAVDVAFAIGIAIALSLLFGAIPAIAFSGAVRTDSLRETRSSSGVASARLRSTLVVAEVALAVVLLVGTALTGRSLQRLLAVDPGFSANGVLAAEVALPSDRYSEKLELIGFFDRVEERLAAHPEVESVGFSWLLPFAGSEAGSNFLIEGRPAPDQGDTWNARYRIADAGYFETLRIPLLEGRSFSRADHDDVPNVALVNETMARLFWPAGDAVGARFRLDEEDPWITIVGVVGDVRHAALDIDPNPEFYGHRQQMAPDFGAVVVRAADGSVDTAAEAVRTAIREVDPDLPLSSIASMRERIESTVGRRRLTAVIVGAFGATALLLSAIGIYGVVSYAVVQRTREIGVRMALGSRAGQVLRLFLREGLALVVLGSVLGVAGALSLGQVVGSQLYGVLATDATSFALAVGVLAAVALLAVLVPARRAARLDPVSTLRAE